MKRGGVVDLKKLSILKFSGKNRLLLILCLLFITGLLLSNLSFAGSKAAVFSKTLFNHYIDLRKDSAFIKTCFSVLTEYFICILILFVAGSSLTGVVLVPAVCCTAGLYYGSLLSFVYSEYSLKGIAFNSVIIIPPALIFIICVLFAANRAFAFSCVLLRGTFPKCRAANLSAEFRVYCFKYLIILLLIVFAAFVDSAVSGSFIKYFSDL